jgi:hydroxylamine dehydrogenase
MKNFKRVMITVLAVLLVCLGGHYAQAVFSPKEITPESAACIECHKMETPSIYNQWGASKHFRSNIGCFECHAAEKGDKDGFQHDVKLADGTVKKGEFISIIVSPRDCARCHEREVEEFVGSHHSKAGRIMGSLDNLLAEVVEGNRGFTSPAFPGGVSAAAVNGCWQCHGTEVKVLKDGKLDPATWPNTGIGRINPDGSEGACTACHSRHAFSVEQVRNPENCGKCHMGPDHPQIEIYNESKHGVAFRAQRSKMNMGNPKWVVGEDYSAAPTCSTCHMSATKKQPVTHNVGLRISWNNRPILSVRPEINDKKWGLASGDIGWEQRRNNMKDVCLNCHNTNFVDGFYKQYDGLIDLYHDKFASPGKELMKLATPLLRPAKFSNKLDFTWFELWHHEGRRARHGASMMGPDITHWHGTYEIARNFYTEFIPELRELAEKGIHSGDAKKVAAAKALNKRIDEIFDTKNHRWFNNKQDADEKAIREARQKEFKARYTK